MAGAATLQARQSFDVLVKEIARRSELNIPKLSAVFEAVNALYGDRKHWSGLTLLEHAVEILRVLKDFGPDDDAVIGCLLQHTLDCKTWTLDDLEQRFGTHVRSIVSGVHLLTHVTTGSKRMTLDDLRLMFLRVSDDVRVILIFLCRQRVKLDLMQHLTQAERTRLCRDMLSIFAPVAARLGIYTLKNQMERLAFPVVYPIDSARITEQMGSIHEQHGKFLDGVAATLRKYLRQEGMTAHVEMREKHPFSIFRKMREKSVSHVEDLYDLFALRVIVQSETACYQVLGLLHRIGHPVAHRFKDYIAFPKPNGYQSLHTTLAHLPGAPDWVFLEVQVRTEAMHREAEYGVAAHWSYKEGGTVEMATRRAHMQKALAYAEEDAGRPEQAVDHIFVLTPRGDIVELPEGATPLDFAFQLHTSLGIAFRAARVNGIVVSQSHALENGDIVEIIKHHDPHPSPRWMHLLKTASARSRLRRYLASQHRPLYLQSGREMLNAELAKKKLPPLDADLSLLRVVDRKTLDVHAREELLVKLGQRSMRVSTLVGQIAALQELRPARRVKNAPKKTVSTTKKPLRVEVSGGIAMPVRYAKCCKPDLKPGIPVTGIVTRGHVRVHNTACRMLRSINTERMVKVRWTQK